MTNRKYISKYNKIYTNVNIIEINSDDISIFIN